MRHSVTRCRGLTQLAIALFILLFRAPSAFSQQTFDKGEFAARRARMFEQVHDDVAIVLAAQEQVLPGKFRQSPDFYYLTGIEEPDAVLVLVGSSRSAILFAPRRPDRSVRIEGPGIWQVDGREEIYGLSAVVPLDELIPRLTVLTRNVEKLYLPISPPDNVEKARSELESRDARYLAHPLYGSIPETKHAANLIRQLLPQLRLADVNPLLDRLRWTKTPYEIERIRRSSQISAEGVNEAIKGTRPGLYEYELEAAARFVFTKRGARGEAFTPIVASGPNSITWHYTANDRQVKAGDVVVMDDGADYDYYTADITRTWPVSGQFTTEQEKMYRCILDARAAIIAAMKPGVTVSNLQDIAERIYRKHGYGQEFLETGRYVGHYVGLSVHDPGPYDRPSTPFEAGVVFNVEPLLERRDQKVHLRLEDTVLIKPTGAENLTAGAVAEIDELYALIRKKALTP